MTTAAAEAIHNARLSERFRIAELAEERAREIEARAAHAAAEGVHDHAFICRGEAGVLRAFAAELREIS